MTNTTDWAERANCLGIDPELFFPDGFPEDDRAFVTQAALDVCAGCQVLTECRAFAFRNHEKHGVWGGLDIADFRAAERRRKATIRRRARRERQRAEQ